jgi:hypothetical protein
MASNAVWSNKDLIKLLDAAVIVHGSLPKDSNKWPKADTDAGHAVWGPMAAACGKSNSQCRGKMLRDYKGEWDSGDVLLLTVQHTDLLIDPVFERLNLPAPAAHRAPPGASCVDSAVGAFLARAEAFLRYVGYRRRFPIGVCVCQARHQSLTLVHLVSAGLRHPHLYSTVHIPCTNTAVPSKCGIRVYMYS